MKIRGQWVDVDGDMAPAGGRHVSALDRGFTLGDGVFETVRAVRGRAFRLGAHISRLRSSAAVLGIPVLQSDDELAKRIDAIVKANGWPEAVVRITVTRGVPAERGLLPPQEARPTTVMQASAWHDLPAAKVTKGLCASISAVRRNEHSPAARIKSCNYLDNILARVEAQREGADEAILVNTSGALACCSAANLHLVRDGNVLTPSLDCGVLAGTVRQVVREICAAQGLGWGEKRLLADELWSADEAFLTNSVVGVVPITSVDKRAVGGGRPGTVTLRLRAAYQNLLRETVG